MEEVSWPFYASALVTGLAFGYVTQRGGFCLTRALSNLYIMGDATIVRAYLLALVVATIGTHLLLGGGLVDLPPSAIRPLHWAANIGGGFLFGVGMILSGGCSGSTWYRIGEGAVGAWVVLLGFAMGATTMTVGILAPVRQSLRSFTVPIDGGAPTLATVIGVSPWIVIAVLGIAVAFFLWRGEGEPEHGKWPWPATGMAVGVLIALGWWTSSFGAPPTGITFASNTGQALTYPLVGYPNRVNWSMVLLVGVPVGAFLAAWPAGEFRWKLPPGWSLVQLFGGGLLMGASAILAEGCNITQGLTNAATLSLGSLVAFGAMWLGAYATVWLLYLRKG
jgi:uncharacterized membrane protein YedE/YeeE